MRQMKVLTLVVCTTYTGYGYLMANEKPELTTLLIALELGSLSAHQTRLKSKPIGVGGTCARYNCTIRLPLGHGLTNLACFFHSGKVIVVQGGCTTTEGGHSATL